MKTIIVATVAFFTALVLLSCNSQNTNDTATADNSSQPVLSGQSGVQDSNSAKNVVQVAMSSNSHTTLVKAVQAAGLVDALSNAGPFTVFAPTDEAFKKLPAGTINNLLKPENKDDLTDILQYHVSVGVFKEDMMQDGQTIGQVNGDNITISKKDDKILINGIANITQTIPASNGIIYVIDAVLLPPAKK